MGEHGGAAELFASEPRHPTRDEADEWLALYEGLVDLVERQLDDTRRFMESATEPARAYLRRENLRILTEELKTLSDRRQWWIDQASRAG